MELYNLINTYAKAAADAQDWDEVLNILGTKSIPKRNPKSWTMADFVSLLGVQDAGLVAGTIMVAGQSNPIFNGAWIALNTTGILLNTDERQAMIDGLALAGNWSNELAVKVKEAGVKWNSPFDLYGLSNITAQNCQDAWTKYLFEQEWILLRETQLWPAIEQGRDATVVALRTIADELEV